MNAIRLRFRSTIPAPVSAVYAWHGRPGTFDRLAPPWQDLKTIDHCGAIDEGDWRLMRFSLGPVGLNWLALHRANVPDRMFSDEQVFGPFSTWRHVHCFDPIDDIRTILTDDLTIRLPFGFIAHPVAGRLVRSSMRAAFRYRHLRTRLDVVRHFRAGIDRPLRVAVLGQGIIAEQLVTFLAGGGHTATRGLALPGTPRIDVVVDLRGMEMDPQPAVVPVSSGNAPATRDLPVSIRVVPRSDDRWPVDGFAARRTVTLRTGVVLTTAAAPLQAWLRLARFGLPVPAGDLLEWIALDDLLGAVLAAIADESLEGSFDVVAPSAITRDQLNAILRREMFPAASLVHTDAGRQSPLSTSGSNLLPGMQVAFPTLERLIRFETGRA